MTDALKAITDLMEHDPDFKAGIETLKSAPDSKPADFIALAAAHGVTLTEADFAAPDSARELSDDELDAVSGAGMACFCFAAGGGGAGGDACACVLGGGGTVSDMCLCALTGVGNDKH